MHTLVVGLNYKTAPVEIREKLSFVEQDIPKAMQALQGKGTQPCILRFFQISVRRMELQILP